MKTINVNYRDYQKALREVHPLDRWDTNKRVVSIIARLTAQRLNKSPAFIEALSNNQVTRVGNMWHNTSNEFGKKLATRLERRLGIKLESEKTLKSGAGGSRADVMIKAMNGVLAEIDFKSNARSALKSVKQMEKHAAHIQEKHGAPPAIQEARNWEDAVRQWAPEVAKVLFKATSLTRARGVAKTISRSSAKVAPAATKSSTQSGYSLGDRGAKSQAARSTTSSAKAAPGAPKFSTRSGSSLGDRGTKANISTSTSGKTGAGNSTSKSATAQAFQIGSETKMSR